MDWKFLYLQAGFRKGKGTRDQIANIHWIIGKQESSRKSSTSTLLTTPKPLPVWVTTIRGKFFKTWVYQTIFPFLLCLLLLFFFFFFFASLLFSGICKVSSDNHFAFLYFFFLGMVLITASCTMSWTLSIVFQALCLSDLIPWISFSLPPYNRTGFDLGHTWIV